MAQFFIDRPVFATVLSIVIMIVGGVALVGMPVAQYPEIVPPTIAIQTAYPGASAQVVADTVTTPIEQEVNGVEGMLYLASKSTNDGQAAIDVTFSLGTDIDQAQVLTQNRVAVALAKLPEEVKRQGVVTKKKSPKPAARQERSACEDLSGQGTRRGTGVCPRAPCRYSRLDSGWMQRTDARQQKVPVVSRDGHFDAVSGVERAGW